MNYVSNSVKNITLLTLLMEIDENDNAEQQFHYIYVYSKYTAQRVKMWKIGLWQ